MAGKKNSALVTMELDLEAYKIKNKKLSEHLIKVQQENLQAYEQLHTIRGQYWKMHRKYCKMHRKYGLLKNLVEDNMRDNIASLKNYQERFKKIYMEENDTTAESIMKSSESPNLSASLHDSRSQQSASHTNDGSGNSLSEDIPRVITTRKKYNSIKENSLNGSSLVNGNESPARPAPNGVKSTSRTAEVQVNISKRREMAEDDHGSVGGTDQHLWDVDVRVRAGDSNTNGGSSDSSDDEDNDDDELNTIQEEDEFSYWSESAKRLKLMVTERKSTPDATVDEDSSMVCQPDDSITERTNASLGEASDYPLERRRPMEEVFNRTLTIPTSAAVENTTISSSSRRSVSANLSENYPDLSNSSRLFMMRSLNLRDMSNADAMRNEASFQTSTPFGDVSPRQRARSKAENATPPCTTLNRSSTSFNSSESCNFTMQPKRMFSENDKNERRTVKTSRRCIEKSVAEPSSSGVSFINGRSKKPANTASPAEQKTSTKTKSKTCKEEKSDDKIGKVVDSERDSKTNRKAFNEERKNEGEKQLETSSDESECEVRKRETLGSSTDEDSTWKDEGTETTGGSSGDETLTEAGDRKKGVKARLRSTRTSSVDSKKVIKVLLDRTEVECYTATTERKERQLKLKKRPGGSEQPPSPSSKKVKRLNQAQRNVEMKKNSPRPTRAARPSKPLCESSLKKKMRRSK